ncbi:MAG: 3'-5' exoribonuclease [Taibaiella sp.]|nr:3'-5' exoribonuclease [Taibaiella sp.]
MHKKNNKKKHVVIDIEANGPIIGKHSMIDFGMVIVEPGFQRTFRGKIRPISDEYVFEALNVSGYSHEETKTFDAPELVMPQAANWLAENIQDRPIFWSDNNGFDKSWMHWYFLIYNNGRDPFGHSSRRITDLICGIEKNLKYNWKRKRKTKHDHNPVNDAKGNAEVLLEYLDKLAL